MTYEKLWRHHREIDLEGRAWILEICHLINSNLL